MAPEGPVIDWLAEKWDALLAMVKAFLLFVETIPQRVEARVDALESRLVWWFVVIAVFLGLIHLVAAWIHARMLRKA